MLYRYSILAALALATAGCLSSGHRASLVKRAAFDLQCAEDQIALTELGDWRSQGVSGCGQRGVYVLSPNGTWLLNSDATRTGEKAP